MESKNLQPGSDFFKSNTSTDAYLADRISELPDEVLDNILSRLAMRDSVGSSMLSRRWKLVWTYTTGSFDFDFGSAALTTMKESQVFTSLETERARYVQRVNKFINSHKGPTIGAFRVKFDLQSSAATDINSWIKFAIRKRVGRLELDLARVDKKHRERSWFSNLYSIKHCYAFPLLETLDNEKRNLSWLTSLNFNFVDMTGESVEYLLSNCPILEYVRILNSPSLAGVRVVATCRKLKHLEIAHCHYLEFIDISSAPNLTSFSYSGPTQTRLCVWDAPNLVNVSLGGLYCVSMIKRFSELHLDLSRIEKLELSPRVAAYTYFRKFPKLEKVTQLELKFMSAIDIDEHSHLTCAYAIEACPNLVELSVQWQWMQKPEIRKKKKVAKGRRCNKCLKVVKLWGFRGSIVDAELAAYIFFKAPSLEKITVDTVNSYYLVGTTARKGRSLSVDENIRARNIVSQLASQFSPAAELIIRPFNHRTAK